ncbi:hypothetical protein DQ384_39210 [Sphaerisporangium album]|uniref:Uncharacterized protein n=1 Tax=Sphaerisporangium album TaxID=509200 RepID=A0A367EKR2_9ACTN|nr:hypothetical protein DQ384_39210 [Sphaerisporangium album]
MRACHALCRTDGELLVCEADAVAILAYLDADPKWSLDQHQNTMYVYVYKVDDVDEEPLEILINTLMNPTALRRVINEINTIALGLPGYVHPAILDRLTAIARLAPADSEIYRVATGQTSSR